MFTDSILAAVDTTNHPQKFNIRIKKHWHQNYVPRPTPFPVNIINTHSNLFKDIVCSCPLVQASSAVAVAFEVDIYV